VTLLSRLRIKPVTSIAHTRICQLGLFLLLLFFWPGESLGRIYIDINSPSLRKFKIAIPDFKNLGSQTEHPELATKLSRVVSNDLDLSGYFTPMDKEAFLEEQTGGVPLKAEDIRFKDWSVIGAELLLKASFTCIGNSLEVEFRLFDVFWGRQILGKRMLGDTRRFRYLMHRVSNEVVKTLTGHDSIFLTKMAFVGNASRHKEIYESDYDGHNLRQLTTYGSISLLPMWSPDGKQMIFTCYKDGGPMVYVKNMASGKVNRISSRSGLNTGAAWAPNENRIALTLSYKGNPDIYLIDLKGKIVRRLTDHWGIDVSPTFSPDGKRLAFVSNRSGYPQIYVLDLGNGTTERLTFEGNYNTSPSWSSLGRIAFVSMEFGELNICTIDPDGGRFRKLTENQRSNEDPCWSPDGRYIAFSSDREGRYHIYIMNANGQNQRRITFGQGDQTTPSWGP
jgi:TolB protein